MAKTVSIPVSVDLKANAASMKELYRDISDLIANIDPSSALAKNINKVMGRLKDQVTDFELISNKSFIQQSDVNSALSIFKRFYRDIGRMNEDIQGAGFNSFIHEDSVIKALQTIQDELDKVQDAAEKIKTVNIGDAFKIENKDQKSIKDLQKKFSLDADDSASLVEARSAAIANLTSKTEEYNQALERQKELQESQKKIQDKITQRSNAYNTNFGTSEQRRKFAFGQMYESIASMKGNWSIDTYEKSFNDIVATFFETTKSGKVKFTNFGQDRLNNLASLLGIDLSTVKQDAATLQQEILKAISNLNFADVKRAIGSGKKEFAAMDDGYQIAKQAWIDYNGFEAKDRIELDNQLKASNTELNNLSAQIPLLKGLMDEADSLQNQIDELYNAVFGDLDKEAREQRKNLRQQMKDIEEASIVPTKQGVQGVTDRTSQDLSKLGEQNEANLAAQKAKAEADAFKANLQASIKHWMGAQQVITLVKQGIRQAYQDIQGLDKAMTNIAVVTDFSVSDLWGKINEYMSIAQRYGVTTQGVYEVSQLYFQQGLGEADTMAATTETLKMARIAGMDYKDAADGMTVAIRGFNMEMQDAARVTDVYSKVAAITASDTQELVTAMSKTASSAAAVGSSFENTTAMLAVMIEATRESPQNLGSALKSIISRYGEMTKGLSEDSEGEEIDYNRVDTALKTVGITLKDAQGQFRDFDTVIEELSAKWDTLDSVTQRYIATIFAGNRQQSRFLALVSNYERYVEVSEAAVNSEDAGLLQYSKTLDSLETKINNIKTSFQQFYMSLINGDNIKGALDFINNLIKGLNKLNKLSSVFSLTGIVASVKLVGSSLVNSLAPYITQISNKFKQGYAEIANSSRVGGMTAGKAFRDAYENAIATGSTETQAMRAGGWAGLKAFGKNHASSIANVAALAGSGLSLLGISMASNNAVLGSSLSMTGSALSGAAMGASFGPWGALIGGITGAVTQLPSLIQSLDKNIQAQEKFSKSQEKAEELNIKRAQTKSDYETLKNSIEKIKELEDTKYDSKEKYQEWIEANNSLVQAYPSLLGYIDEAGNSIADLSSSTDLLSSSMQRAAKASRDYYVSEINSLEEQVKLNKNWEYADPSVGLVGADSFQSGMGITYFDVSQAFNQGLSHSFYTTPELINNYLKQYQTNVLELINQANAGILTETNDLLVKALVEYGAIIKDSDTGIYSLEEHLQEYTEAEKQLQNIFSTKQAAMQAGINLASLQSELDDSVSSIEGYSNIIMELSKLSLNIDEMDYEQLANLSVSTYEDIITSFINLYNSLSDSDKNLLSSLYGNLTDYTFEDLNNLLLNSFKLDKDSQIYQTFAKLWSDTNYQGSGKILSSIVSNEIDILAKAKEEILSTFEEENKPKEIGDQDSFLNRKKNEFTRLALASGDYNTYSEEWYKAIESSLKLTAGTSLTKEERLSAAYSAVGSYEDYLFKQSGAEKKALEEWQSKEEEYNQAEEAYLKKYEAKREEFSFELLSYAEWLQANVEVFDETVSEDTKKQEYDKYTKEWAKEYYDALKEIGVNEDHIFFTLFKEDGSLSVSLDAAQNILSFFSEAEDYSQKTNSVLAREASNARKITFSKIAAEINKIDFTKENWFNDEQSIANLTSFITGGLENLTESDLGELSQLLLSDDAGTIDWKNKILSFVASKGLTITENLNDYVYESLITSINNTIPDSEEFVSGMEDLFSKQESGFTVEEADKIINALNKTGLSLSRAEVFDINDGKLVISEFDAVLTTLYQNKIDLLEGANAELESLGKDSNNKLKTFLSRTGEELLSKAKERDAKTNEYTKEALNAQQGLFAYLTNVEDRGGLGFSNEAADAALEYVLVNSELSYEGLINYFQQMAQSNAELADYYNSLANNLGKEKAFKDFKEKKYDKANLLKNAVDSPTIDAIGQYAIKEGLLKENETFEEFFKRLDGITIDEFGEGNILDPEAFIRSLTGNIDGPLSNYQQTLIGILIENISNNIKELFESAASLGEEIGEEGRKTVSKKELFELIGDKVVNFEEIYENLLNYINAGAYGSFGSLLSSYSGGAYSSEEGAIIGQELLKGISRGFNSFTEDLAEEKIKYITGELTKEDLDSMSSLEGGAEVITKLKETLPAEINDWADAIIQQKIDAIEAVLSQEVTNQNITELEKAEQLEKYSAELLDAEYGLLTNQEEILQEARDILIETGGKNLTSEQVTALSRAGEEVYVTATASGYQIDKSKLSKESQSLIDRYYDTLAQNAAEGAGQLLSTMVEGTLTGAQIQDYFKELDIDIDYATAENLANGTLEGLLESIKTSLADSNIDVSDKMDEIMAAVMDAILNSISSGISSLGSGLEGTLGAADYQSLAKKYGLTGVGTSKTSKGIRLGTADQQKLISQMFLEAQSAGLESDFGEQIWEVYRDNQEDAIDGYTAIEEEIARVKSEHEELTGEALAYVEALQQARHAAMFDEDSVEFAFMEQDATDGLTKNFDKFVDNIDKVKGAFSAFESGEAVGYQDFYNMMDFIGNSEAGFAKFSEMTGIAAADYEAFINSVVANTDKWGKVDIGGVAAEMGISVDAAMSAMSESMTEGLKEVAKQQIKYLTGLEQMLLALAALEAIGDIDLSLGIDINGDGKVDINDSLDQIADNWGYLNSLPDTKKLEIEAAINQKLGELGKAGLDTLFKQWGLGDNFFSTIFGKDGFKISDLAEVEAADFWGTFAKAIPDMSQLTQGQAMTVAEDMHRALSGYMQFDEAGNFVGFLDGYQDALTSFIKNYDFSNVKESLNTALRAKMGAEGKTAIPLNTSGFELKLEGDGIKIENLTAEDLLDPKIKESLMKDLSDYLGQIVTDIKLNEDGTISIFGENGLINIDGAEEINKNFQTAAEAASTLQTAITQISTVASTFQAGSGFQSLADQLNAAADAAKRLNEALSDEVEAPDTSFIEAQLASAEQTLALLQMGGASPEIIAEAQAQVTALQTQLNSLTVPTGTTTGLVGELTTAIDIANKLSEALSNNNGTPLEVNFNADDANGQVTALITNLLQLNDVFQPTITVDDAEAQNTIADVLMQLENVHVQNPTPIVDITDNASATLQSIIGLIASINSKTVTITTIHKDIYMTSFSRGGGGGDNQSYSMRWTGTANDITGPARAGGTVGNLQKGAQLANKTLVGELGPELAVYDGKYHLLGESGAEFVKLPKSAIVFNHLQTAGILSGQMKNARGEPLTPGGALVTGNVTGPAAASGIAGALAAVRRAKSVWQGLLNSLSAADLMGGGGGGGGGGGDDNSLKAHIADLQEWYNLSRQIADIEGQINILLAKRKSITDGHEYLRNLRETQRLLDDQVNTQQDLLRFQQLQLQRQAEHINNNKIWSQFLQVDENGLLQYKKGNETNGGKGALEVLQQMNEMSGSEQLAFVQSLGWSYTNTDGEELEDEELVAKFFEELQKQIDDYDALRDTVVEAEEALADLEEEINEIEREIRDNEIDLSKEIYDIIVDAWKENIENLKEQNDLIKEANEAYANGIQEAIDAERRMYEQNTTISDREQLQRQLALMRRSGGSASEIADLEQQLDDMLKEEYFSNQEKQLETIQKANERQAELLDQQVKIQEEMLEYQQENGVIWQKVYEVMSGTDAEIIDFMLGNSTNFFEQSALQQEDMLTEWAKKIGIYTEERQRQNYTAEAEKTFDSVWDTETGEKLQEAYNQADSKDQQTWKREYNDTYASKRLEGMTYEEASKYAQNEFYEHIQNWLKAQEDEQNQQDSGSNNNNSNNSTKGRYETVTYWQAYGRVGNSQGDKKVTGPRTTNGESAARQALKANNPAAFNIQVSKWTVQEWRKYAKGGIIDFTGPAWVDGSKSKPERILSAEQNKILEEGLAMNAGRSDKLKDMFADFATILGSSIRESITNIATNTSSQAITIQPGAIQLNISQLNDSYDVDELFNDVADRLYSIAARASSRGVRRR